MFDLKQPKLRFKQVDGSDFPQWEKTLLSDIAQIVGGGTPPTENEECWDGNINWFTPSEIKDKYIFSSEKKITKLGLQKSSAKILPIGSILFTSRASIGHKSITKEECCTNQGFQSFVVKETIDRDFIYYSISHNEKKFHRLAQGSTFKEVYKKDISKIIFFIPHLHEQQKIATFLSLVDKKTELLCKKHKLLEKYKKGLMQKIFSQEVRFKQNDGNDFPEWDRFELGSISDLYQPKTISKQNLTNEGFDVYGANGIIGKYSMYNHEEAQIAITCRGATCGKVNFTNPKSWITGNAMVVNVESSKNVIKLFLYQLLKKTNFTYLITGGAQPQITGIIKKHKIDLPSLKEQEKIALFLTSVDKKIDLVKKQIEKTQTFKKGLLQQMFV